jgi:tyrosyl-tRNA synthetase
MARATPRKKFISETLSRSVERIYPSKAVLQKALEKGERLKIYLGVDPTGPHLHLGHLTNFLVLRRFQQLGNEIIFLIGDFTGMVGDPTDKLAARKPLTESEVRENFKTFQAQIENVLNFGGLNHVHVRFNSEWLRDMKLSDVMSLASKVTVQQLLERDMFQGRIKAKKPIHLHEFIYPLLQGYDSVAMNVDGEIGGSDQTFNMLMGRNLQKSLNNKEKFVITTKLLVHPKTGKKLMNKSEGGMINLDDSAADVFGKVMALDDESMFQIAEHCTEISLEKLSRLVKGVKKGSIHPKDAKLTIAEAVTEVVYGLDIAKKIKQEFLETFSKGKIAGEVPTLIIPKPISLLDLVSHSGVAKSKSEARRLIEQGAVEVDKKRKNDPYEEVKFKGGEVLKVGKKSFFKIEIK